MQHNYCQRITWMKLQTVMMVGMATLLSLTAFECSAIDQPAEKPPLVLKGYLLDYEWAHTSQRFAMLFHTPENQYFLSVFDVTHDTTSIVIPLPEPLRPRCFGWLADDSGFLIAVARADDADSPDEDQFYQYTFASQELVRVYEDLERVYAQIFDIVFDRDSAWWAVAYVGEGHPDVAIYQDSSFIQATDVYPSFIAPVTWRDHWLYCTTGAYLEFGLTRTDREQHPQFDPEKYPERDWGAPIVYRIDPQSKTAEQVTVDAEVLVNTSCDGRYTSAVTHNDETFTVLFLAAK